MAQIDKSVSLFDNAEIDDRFVGSDNEIYLYAGKTNIGNKSYAILHMMNDYAREKTDYFVSNDGAFIYDYEVRITEKYDPEKHGAHVKPLEERVNELKSDLCKINQIYVDTACDTIEKCKQIILDTLAYTDDNGDLHYHGGVLIGKLPDDWKTRQYTHLPDILLNSYQLVYGYDGCVTYIHITISDDDPKKPVLKGITLSFANKRGLCIYGNDGYQIASHVNPLSIIDVTKIVLKYAHLLNVPSHNWDAMKGDY